MIGTSDQSCCLAGACKILLLLLETIATDVDKVSEFDPNTPTIVSMRISYVAHHELGSVQVQLLQ